ncbi:hypothetical protein PsAD5_00149 [Pseudovibrio sp. Ad5]|uniref:DUF2213 domain-containing protein n=1 Tax=Pseudovibrio sp. Ad5 TaxID=989436 RepID=UPI0007AE9D7A|nr:DUF2213 domain-containing protein [Pseudovibrio sp. Ad5]KZL02199.1 hypothetical protein PsAD5_00149 [Pseudovibrio sp. Ad5]
MKSINLTELVDAGATRKTSDGYLIADAKVARTGIQRYAGYELGFADRGVMRVYRPEEEVFKAASLASFAGKPVTNDHPATSVSAEDWKEKAVGHVGNDIARDGEFVRVPFTVMDKATVEQVEGGKRQLSVGYSATLTVEDGFTPEGEPYDAVQRDIKVNHLALVRAARAGSEARIEDGAKWGASPIFDHKEEAIVKTYNIAVGDKAFVVNEDGKEAVDAMKIIVADKDAELAEAQKQANEAQAKADMLADCPSSKIVGQNWLSISGVSGPIAC